MKTGILHHEDQLGAILPQYQFMKTGMLHHEDQLGAVQYQFMKTGMLHHEDQLGAVQYQFMKTGMLHHEDKLGAVLPQSDSENVKTCIVLAGLHASAVQFRHMMATALVCHMFGLPCLMGMCAFFSFYLAVNGQCDRCSF